MRTVVPSVLLAFALLTPTMVGCGGHQTQFEMKGRDSDLVKVAGDWNGTYAGTDSGRRGEIRLNLEVGRHTGNGSVMMGSTALPFSYVAVEGTELTGELEHYIDPQCQCEVETTFVGSRMGDMLFGSFTTKVIGRDTEQRGEWSARRL